MTTMAIGAEDSIALWRWGTFSFHRSLTPPTLLEMTSCKRNGAWSGDGKHWKIPSPQTMKKTDVPCSLPLISLKFLCVCVCERGRTSVFQKHSVKNYPLRLDPETTKPLQLISAALIIHPRRVPKRRKIIWCVINSNFQGFDSPIKTDLTPSS